MKQALSISVSVIIPTYNRAWILREAIDSVLNQTYTNFELIVVDDGSTDATSQLLTAYKDRIKIIHQQNQGVSAARNRGILNASGNLIALLDSDDLWLREKLACQIAFFEENHQALICQTEEIWIRNGVRVNPKKHHQKPSGMIFEPSLALCLVSPSAVMMRRELLDEVGLFDEQLPACEDYDLWLRIGCKHPIHLIDKPLIFKRGGHPDQLSKAWGLDRFRICSIQKLIDSADLSPIQKKAAAAMLRKKCRIYAKGCLKHGREKEAAHFFSLIKQYAHKQNDSSR